MHPLRSFRQPQGTPQFYLLLTFCPEQSDSTQIHAPSPCPQAHLHSLPAFPDRHSHTPCTCHSHTLLPSSILTPNSPACCFTTSVPNRPTCTHCSPPVTATACAAAASRCEWRSTHAPGGYSWSGRRASPWRGCCPATRTYASCWLASCHCSACQRHRSACSKMQSCCGDSPPCPSSPS